MWVGRGQESHLVAHHRPAEVLFRLIGLSSDPTGAIHTCCSHMVLNQCDIPVS